MRRQHGLRDVSRRRRPRGLSCIAALLCAAIMLMQTGILCGASAGSGWMEICSGADIVLMRTAPDGSAEAPLQAPSTHCEYCGFCTMSGAIDAPGAQDPLRTDRPVALEISVRASQHAASQGYLWPQTRGPPAGTAIDDISDMTILAPIHPIGRAPWV